MTKPKSFKQGSGDWTKYRSQFGLSKGDEINLHFGGRERSTSSFDEVMAEVSRMVEGSLNEAQRNDRSYVMFIRGKSTSRPGKTTARSQVRNLCAPRPQHHSLIAGNAYSTKRYSSRKFARKLEHEMKVKEGKLAARGDHIEEVHLSTSLAAPIISDEVLVSVRMVHGL